MVATGSWICGIHIDDTLRSCAWRRAKQGYYPAFPYRWYTGMSAEDVADLWAYLRSVPPVERPVGPHELPFPLDLKALLRSWKLVNFEQAATVADPARSAAWNRGHLVNHLGHCGACHTPKLLGAVFLSFKFLAGSAAIPGATPLPTSRPTRSPGSAAGRRPTWSGRSAARSRPPGEPIRGPMAEYVANGSSRLTAADLTAMAT